MASPQRPRRSRPPTRASRLLSCDLTMSMKPILSPAMPSNPDLNDDPDTVAALEEYIRTLGKGH